MTGKRSRGQDTLNKPYDEDFLKNPFGNVFGEGKLVDIFFGKEEEKYEGVRPSVDSSFRVTLEKMSRKFGKTSIINENYNNTLQEEYELEFQEDDE